MADLLSYSVDDFVLFSLQAYYGLFEHVNVRYWPFGHIIAVIAGLVIVWAATSRLRLAAVAGFTLLAGCWAWTGWFFVSSQYATINWAIAYIAPLFGLQSLMLAVLGMRSVATNATGARKIALLIGGLAVAFYPIASVALGRPWQVVDVFGLSADPLVAATLGILIAHKGFWAAACWLVPLVWATMSGFTLWVLGSSDWFLLPATALTCLLIVLKGRFAPGAVCKPIHK